jgi:uncharacterized protein (DUF1800 family)
MHPVQKQNHLFWRAGFGSTPDLIDHALRFNPGQYVKALLKASEKAPVPFLVVNNIMDGLGNGIGEIGRMQPKATSDSISAAQQRQQMQRQNRQATRSLNLTWMDEMVNSPAQIREKMALFWHGHFACRNLNSYFQQQLINIIREHALSDFGTLLNAVSKSPAMLQFLNNQQNRKNSPNENFAREVMELFTLGRGHYTEKDVKEAARAFTGWGFNLQGQYQFRPFQHDAGEKTVLGKKGNLTGEDVIDILLSQNQTAHFICTKLYKFYVNDNVNADHVAWLSKRFYESGYEIKPLLFDLFTADWFYDPLNVGTHIKSPVELLVGIQRQLPMEIGNEEILLLLQRALGQILFYPPNVAGWPGGRSWIDSSSLLLRLRLPQIFSKEDGIEINFKADDDTEMGMARKTSVALNRYSLKAEIEWDKVLSPFEKLPGPKQNEMLTTGFLQTKRLPEPSFLRELTKGSNDARHLIIAMMSLPEYQLC